MKSINPIDAAILKALLRDSRKPFVDIAKERGVSKDVIWRSYYKMKQKRIITGATAQIYYEKIGYAGVATIQLNVESQAVNDVFTELRDNPEVYIFRQYNGRFNIGGITRFRRLRDLERLKEVVCRNKMVNEVKTYIWTDVRNIPENIIPNGSDAMANEVNILPFSEVETTDWKIDELDRHIIGTLTIDGRASFRKIGMRVGAATDTVARRYEALRKNNYVKTTIQINPNKLGYHAILDTSIALSTQSETAKIVEALARIPCVSYIVKIAGDYDLQVVTLVGETKDVIAINDEIENIPHIKRIEAFLRHFRPNQEVWPGRDQHITTF